MKVEPEKDKTQSWWSSLVKPKVAVRFTVEEANDTARIRNLRREFELIGDTSVVVTEEDVKKYKIKYRGKS